MSAGLRNVDYSDDSDVSDQERSAMEETVSEVHRGGRGNRKQRQGKKGGIDLDECDASIRHCAQTTEEINNDISSIRNQHQSQSRRIHDLQMQFEEARARLDKLLNRTTRRRDYDSDFTVPTPVRRRVEDDDDYDVSSSRYQRSRYDDDDNDSNSSSSRYDYDSGISSSRSSDTGDGNSGKREFKKQSSQTSVMTMNLKAPSKPFEMVSLTVKIDEDNQ